MGTRGLLIVRFGGRYYVYYNHFDSYPDGLGSELVEQIPVDKEKYQEWLARQRAIFAQMESDLEAKVLTVTEETLRTYGSEEEEFTTFTMLDDRLSELPSPFCTMSTDLYIEWTYTVDLDLEVFSVDSWIHFPLDNIPRDRWMKGFEREREEESGEAKEESGEAMEVSRGDSKKESEGESSEAFEVGKQFSFKICPEGTDQIAPFEYFTNDEPRDKWMAMFRVYKCYTVTTKSRFDDFPNVSHRQIISGLLFEGLISQQELIYSWNHDDFAFRELAFAILSLATGQYHFNTLRKLNGNTDDGYLIDPGDDISNRNPRLLPLFGKGCHSPGVNAGSAPHTSIYWFENVLISLVPDNIIRSDTEAAIARVVAFGLEEGKVDFYAIVLSLVHVVMLEVEVKDGVTIVKHTKPKELSTRGGRYGGGANTFEARHNGNEGFRNLIYFFNTVANRHLSVYRRGRFPTEIYSKILSYTDNATYETCAKVSAIFRLLHQETIYLSRDLEITKFSAKPDDIPTDRVFTLRNRINGRIMHSGVICIAETNGESWCPVIGGARPSLLSNNQLWFVGQAKPDKYNRFTGISMLTREFARREPSIRRASVSSTGFNDGFERYDKLPIIWKLPQNVVLNKVEKIWGIYLDQFFREDPESPAWMVRKAQFTCAMAPNYRELYMNYRHFETFRVFLRRPVDGDTEQKRSETLAYIAARLLVKARKDELVMIAFGFDVAFYDWKATESSSGSNTNISTNTERSLIFRGGCKDYSQKGPRAELEKKFLVPLKESWQEVFAGKLKAETEEPLEESALFSLPESKPSM